MTRPSTVLTATALFLLVALLPGGIAASPVDVQYLWRNDAPILMGTFTTYYPGSRAGRNYNMARASDRLNGAVIPPGGIFSFNDWVGPADQSTGYRMAFVFVGNRIVPGYGGGVCQVVSTLYNAVVRAGLAIRRRSLHGLTVPYLPPGQDATIAYGSLDLAFQNDTSGPVVLYARGMGPRVHIAIYGSREPPFTRFRTRTRDVVPIVTRLIEDPSLAPGSERVLAQGQPGLTAHTWLYTAFPSRVGREVDLGEHTYRMSPRIVAVGPRRR